MIINAFYFINKFGNCQLPSCSPLAKKRKNSRPSPPDDYRDVSKLEMDIFVEIQGYMSFKLCVCGGEGGGDLVL